MYKLIEQGYKNKDNYYIKELPDGTKQYAINIKHSNTKDIYYTCHEENNEDHIHVIFKKNSHLNNYVYLVVIEIIN